MRLTPLDTAFSAFGSHLVVDTCDLPPFDYPSVMTVNEIADSLYLFHQRLQIKDTALFHERLGPAPATQSPWQQFVNEEFSKDRNISDHELTDLIVAKARENLVLALTERGADPRTSRPDKSSLFAISRRKAPRISVDMEFWLFIAKVNRLGSEIELPEQLMEIGDKVYHLVETDIRNLGTRIFEYTIEDRSLLRSWSDEHSFGVSYRATRPESRMPLHFQLDAKGVVWMTGYGDASSPGGKFFRSLKDAEKAEADAWIKVNDRFLAFKLAKPHLF